MKEASAFRGRGRGRGRGALRARGAWRGRGGRGGGAGEIHFFFISNYFCQIHDERLLIFLPKPVMNVA